MSLALLGEVLRALALLLFRRTSFVTRRLVRGLDQLSGLPWLRDLFTSDAFVPHSAVYGWIANQFGHFAIGVAVGAAPWMVPVERSSAVAITLAAALVYLFKELTDAQGEVALSQKLGSPFRIDQRTLAQDGVADTLFVWLGLLVGFVAAQPGEATWFAFVLWAGGVGAVAVALAAWELPGREAFDESGLPRYVGLSRYNARFEGQIDGEHHAVETMAATLQDWIDAADGESRIVTIEGASGFGKTTLACGIASAHTDRARKVRYVHCSDLPLDDADRDGLAVLVVDDLTPAACDVDRLLAMTSNDRLAMLILTHAEPLPITPVSGVRLMRLRLTVKVDPELD